MATPQAIRAEDPATHAADATAITVPLINDERTCIDAFATHYLLHSTNSADGVIRMFQANGSGIAAGDLDGDLDLVLGNLYGPDAILWNEGDLSFSKQSFGDGNTRALSLVDVDGDALLDIVLTRDTGVLNHYRNLGDRRFAIETLPGVAHPASVLNWADLDGDGDLDLVTASYDAGLLIDRGNAFLLDGGGGIIQYRNESGRYTPTVLDAETQALALALHDIDRDGRLDMLVANDFAMPDRTLLQTDDG